MTNFKLITKSEFSSLVNDYLDRLLNIGLNQSKIGELLGVTDRTIRKWQYFESCPNGNQFCNLMILCKIKKVA